MDVSRYLQKISLGCWIALTIAVLCGILFFGLRPKDFSFSNHVEWITKQPGIRFSRYGIAYTVPIKALSKTNDAYTNGFSIEIALKPESYHEEGFNVILALHDGIDGEQLIVGQWRSWFIIMNGDDYDHRRRTKRITIKPDEAPPKTRYVTITTGKNGTRVYLEGRIVRTDRDLTLRIPEEGNTRLLLGNSVYGKSSWKGDIYGLALYPYPFTIKDAAIHFNKWIKDGSFRFAEKYNPLFLYVFDEGGGHRALDHGNGNFDLEIPSKMKILNKKFLSFTWNRTHFDPNFIRDIMINFAGFIPLGFFLSATFATSGGSLEKHAALVTVVLCFFVSLIIEILQAWVPSRSSDGLDLVLNTLGGCLGVTGYILLNRKQKRSEIME